jgi:hypothetical protein
MLAAVSEPPSHLVGGVADTASIGALREARVRCEATLETLAEVIGAGHRGEPILAMRAYAGSCLAVAVGGVIDPPTLGRLRALHDDPLLAALSSGELVLDLSQVQESAPGLPTVLAESPQSSGGFCGTVCCPVSREATSLSSATSWGPGSSLQCCVECRIDLEQGLVVEDGPRHLGCFGVADDAEVDVRVARLVGQVAEHGGGGGSLRGADGREVDHERLDGAGE